MTKVFANRILRMCMLSGMIFFQIVASAQNPILHKDYEDAYLGGVKKPCFVNNDFDVLILEDITNKDALLKLNEERYNLTMNNERVVDFLKKSTFVSCHRVNYIFDVAPINGIVKGNIKFHNGKIYAFEYAYTGYGFIYDEEKRIIWGLGNPKILAISDELSQNESGCPSKCKIDYKLSQYPNEISILDSIE